MGHCTGGGRDSVGMCVGGTVAVLALVLHVNVGVCAAGGGRASHVGVVCAQCVTQGIRGNFALVLAAGGRVLIRGCDTSGVVGRGVHVGRRMRRVITVGRDVYAKLRENGRDPWRIEAAHAGTVLEAGGGAW